MPKKISVCIPVFNEAANLPVAVEAVEQLFRDELGAYDLEIIITDNASTDATWDVVHQLAAERPHLKAYRFSRNFGYQNSVFAGISMATGNAVVELDADLEDPPAVIPRFIEKWEEGFDVAYGVRVTRHGSWFLRLTFSLFYRVLNKLSDFPIPKDSGDFRLLDRMVLEVLKNLPERNLYLRGLVSYLGFRQAEVLYDRQPRIGGASKFSFLHYTTLAIDALTAFSKAPLRLIGILGIILFALSMLLSLYYLYGRIFHGTLLPGFTTLAILTLMLNSVTFIFLGILGEYLSRIFDDAKGRPRVIIRDSINADCVPPCL